MTARTYVREPGKDEIEIKPGRRCVEVDVLRRDGLRAPIKRINAADPDRAAAEIGASLLDDGYILTLGEQS